MELFSCTFGELTIDTNIQRFPSFQHHIEYDTYILEILFQLLSSPNEVDSNTSDDSSVSSLKLFRIPSDSSLSLAISERRR